MLIVNDTSGLREKNSVVIAAIRALTIASGGAATATIDRTKKPVAMASVTKLASRNLKRSGRNARECRQDAA